MPEDMLQYLGAFIRKSRKAIWRIGSAYSKNRERTNKSIL